MKRRADIPMKFLLAFVLIAGIQNAFAQAADSITHHYDSLAKIKLQALDSSGNRFNKKVDSIQLRLNNVINPDLNSMATRLRKKKLAPADTTIAVHELDSMKRGVSTKIDSLKALNLPTDRYARKLDSLNNISPQKYIEATNARIQSAENKINQPINDIEGKVNDKLNAVRSEAGDKANLPGNLDTRDIGLNKDLSLDTDINKNLDVNPDMDNPLNKIDNPISDQTSQLGDLKGKVSDIQSAPQQQIDKVKSIDEIKTVQEKLGDVNKTTDQIQSYQNDVKNISQGDLSEVKNIQGTVENKVQNLDEVKELSKQTGELDKAKGMIDQGKNPEAMKDMAQEQIQKQAVDHFKGKEQVLQAAMDKLSKIKAKYPDLASLKDIPKRPPNPMKGKPLIERIVPGVTIQLQRTNRWLLDVNPVVSYRFTGRINAGLGWNERLSFIKWNKLSMPDRIYGPRVFGSFSFKKGFSAKAEIEKMNTIIPPTPIAPDGLRRWVWSAFVGLKKDYKFMGSVRGNVQILYNIYDDHDNSPYIDRLNVRMGFEFPMKKSKKSISN